MATQTGSIDLRGANSAKLYVDDEAGEIRSEVSETYATKTEVRRTDTGSGTVISSDDAANLPPLSLTIHGKSVQDGTPSPSSPVEIRSVEGRNLLKTVAESWTTNGVTITINANSTVTMRGTATAQTDIWLSQAASSKNPIYVPAGSYTLSASKELPSGVRLICSGGGYNGYGYNELTGVRTHTSTVTDASKPFSYFMLRIANGTTVDDTIGVMLEAGTQATGFIPYGSIGLATNGVNNIDVADVASTTLMDTYYYELTYGTKKLPRFNLEAGTTYTLSATVQTDVVPFQMSVGCGVSGYSRDITNKGYAAAGRVSITFTPTAAQLESGTVLAIRAPRYSTKETFTFSLSDIQLEYGGTAHDYEPCSTTITPIDLDGNSVCATPSVGDVLEVDSEGNVTLTKNTMRKVFDGTETWTAYNGGGSIGYYFYTNMPNAAASQTRPTLLCSHCVGSTAVSPTKDMVTIGTTKNVLFAFGTTLGISTAADWKTWLASNPVTLIYKLDTPQTISLGKIDLPSLPSPSFSMHVDAAVTPTIDAEWWTQGGEEVGSVYQRTSALEQDVDGLTLELSEKVDSSEEWVSWLHAGTDATTHEPYLAMGKNSAYPSVVYGSDAARFYDGEGDAASNVVASFGTEGVTVGKDGSANTTISDSEIVFHDADGNEAGKISMSSAGAVPASASHTITAGTSTQSYTLEGLTPLPDFTLGSLVVDLLYNGTLLHKYIYTSFTGAEFAVSIDTSTDATFTAAQSGDTWGATLTAQHRVVGETADFTFSLKWVYRGTAPMYEFGTAENTGAYSFSAGTGLVAAGPSQAVFGTYNKASQTDLFIVGNGTSDEGRSNALKVDSQGTLETSGYFQLGGNVGLGTVAQEGWLAALGAPFLQFAEVTTATQSISSGSIGYFSVAAPTYTGYTLRGAIQVWASGSGTVIIGASYRSSSDNYMHFVVRANNSASVAVKALLLYTRDAITFTS